MSARLASSITLACALLSAPLAGCTDNGYCFTCDEGADASAAGGGGSGGGWEGGAPEGAAGGFFLDGGGGAADAAKDGEPDADAACSADTQTDPKNCGACGNVCELLGAFPKCVGGVCAVDSCAPGRWNLNQIDSDGCEYACAKSASGQEECNGKDDDCDGETDEGFDVTTDPSNCGSCGNVCSLPNATAGCAEVAGIVRCVIASCAEGFADLDTVASDGCEYECPVWPKVAEACNDVDDDCDGNVNNGNPGGGQPCGDSCPGGVCKGECAEGVTTCLGVSLVCMGGVGPGPEVCNGKDDDCDGVTDNGFDLTIDPLNCGACGASCVPEHAVGGCDSGSCVIDACHPGFANVDGDPSTGCEYSCPVWPQGLETCNGKDDDCDGQTDEAADLALTKPPASSCYPKPGTPCEGADTVCSGADGWRCSYPASVEVDADGVLLAVELRCDGQDGNCNGQVDESFPDLGTGCDNGKLGACRDGGKRVCSSAQDSTECDLSVKPDPVAGAPFADESCNGVDDDCDGEVDEEIADEMIHVTWGGADFWIDRWEASRPDATSAFAGTTTSRSCTKPDVLPWTRVSHSAAAAACATRGARLCTASELQLACAGAAGLTYPYGATYEPLSCNGLDFDGVPGGADDDVVVPAGDASLSTCVTAEGVHDLSGNVSEWSSTVTGTTPVTNIPIYQVRGGSFASPSQGLTCQFSLSRYAATASLDDLGFRCCKD